MYLQTVEREKNLRQTMIDFLDSLGIPVVDALQPLQAELDAGNQPYSVSADGHKNPVGHAVVAKFVMTALQKTIPEIFRGCVWSPQQ